VDGIYTSRRKTPDSLTSGEKEEEPAKYVDQKMLFELPRVPASPDVARPS
jgi:hypothetical protein